MSLIANRRPLLSCGPPSWVRAAYPGAWPYLSMVARFDQGLYWVRGLGQCSPTALFASTGSAKWVTSASGLLIPIAAGALPIGPGTGLLPEDSRTNLFLQSDSLSNAAWFTGGANPAIVSTNNIAPDGSATAVRLTMGAGGAAGTRQSVVVTNNQPVVISVYAKLAPSNAATNFRICTNNSGAWNTGGDVVVALTNSWQRVTLTYQNSFGTTVAAYFGAQKSDISVDATCQGDVLLWGADFNANNTIPLSHISTTTATVTRTVDAITGNLGAWFNPNAGTYVSQFSMPIPNTANAPVAGFIQTNSNAMYPYVPGGAAGLTYFMNSGGSLQYSTASGATLVNGATNKVAMGYGGSPDCGSINGANTATPAHVSLPSPLTKVIFGSASPFGGDGCLNGPIQGFAYAPVRLPNALITAASA